RKTVELFRADYGYIRFLNDTAVTTVPDPLAAASSEKAAAESPQNGENVPFPEIPKSVLQAGDSPVFEDASPKPRPHQKDAASTLRSFAYFPLKVKGEVQGVIALGSHKSFHFTKKDIRLLNAVGEQIGESFRNSRLYAAFGFFGIPTVG